MLTRPSLKGGYEGLDQRTFGEGTRDFERRTAQQILPNGNGHGATF